MNHWNEILVAAKALHRWGAFAQLGVFLFGLAIVLVGRRIFRPSAGLLAGVAFWLVAHTSLAQSFLPPEAKTVLALGVMVLGFFVFGVLLPMAGALMAAGLIGVELGLRLGAMAGADLQISVIIGSVGMVIVGGLLHPIMASLIPALVGTGLMSLALFVLAASHPQAPEGIRVPMVWLSIWFMLCSLAIGWDVLLDKWERRYRHRRAVKEDERAQLEREERDRKRYARYMS